MMKICPKKRKWKYDLNFNDLYPIIQDTVPVLSTQLSAPMGAAQSTKTFEQSDPESPYIDGDVVRLF